MNTSFIPKACLGDKATFTGSLVVRMPSGDEYFDFLADSSIEDVENIEKSSNSSRMKTLAAMIRKSYDHIVKVDLVKKADGTKINTVELLKYDKDCRAILTELAGNMMSGFAMGKN